MRPSALAAFLVGSFVAHGVAYAALASLPLDGQTAARSIEVAFTVFEPSPEPEPLALPEPPKPVTAVVPPARPRRPEPKSMLPQRPETPPAEAEPPQVRAEAAEVVDAEPAPLTLGVTSATGLAVAGIVGTRASNGNGSGAGTGTGAGTPVAKVDLRPIATDWVRKVNLAISSRALRDYPRSALRAHLEGSVLLAVQVDIHGRLSGVAIQQSSGHAQLDQAALAAARALGELPAPPEALHGKLRPIRIPINYRVQ